MNVGLWWVWPENTEPTDMNKKNFDVLHASSYFTWNHTYIVVFPQKCGKLCDWQSNMVQNLNEESACIQCIIKNPITHKACSTITKNEFTCTLRLRAHSKSAWLMQSLLFEVSMYTDTNMRLKVSSRQAVFLAFLLKCSHAVVLCVAENHMPKCSLWGTNGEL